MNKKNKCKEELRHGECCGHDETSQAEDGASGSGEMLEVKRADYEALESQAKDFKDKYLRILAEFENVRKRNEREKIEFVKYANEGLIREFLLVLDDLERSVETAQAKHQDYDSFIRGVEIVMKRVYGLLKKQGVVPIESIGKMFDPHMHEILTQAPSPEHENGTVIQELQKGYRIGDRVVRTSKVGVAMNPSSTAAEQSNTQGGEGRIQPEDGIKE